MWKRGEITISPLFHNIFNISRISSPITYKFVKCGCSIYFFLNSPILTSRDTDITKYFRESLGMRDNEIRQYPTITTCDCFAMVCVFIDQIKIIKKTRRVKIKGLHTYALT